ncbi:hypothetical protein OGAPHI_000546 [Ogataea philodendri]|uniref:Major facilitator superfamily (MFS) profile domain-containing protein n=1 Tax=Ogataea philodendri TaxID=1378263 RepID=A0A9P8PFH0_9ASCO|nr:uncharacterized protein OGAPHI_000546 [Ogataea philodendri]KAH3671323.1 hypothetical protein OGAPHI_000546 [Ogataea philodendri]
MERSAKQLKLAKATGERIASVLPDDSRTWWQRPNLLKLYLLLCNFVLFASSIGYDSAITNSIQNIPAWLTFMNDPTGTWLGFISASPFVGTCGTIFFVPWICDRFGRKVVIYMTVLCIWIGSILGAAAKNPATYIVSRIFMGFSFSCNYAASVWISEIAYPTTRGKFSAAYHAIYYFGSVLCAWVVFGTQYIKDDNSWRIPLALQAAIPTCLLPALIYAPESPRWLISVGKVDQARRVLLKFHANYEEEYLPLVELEMQEITAGIEALRANNISSWKSLISTPGNRKRLFISCFLGIAFAWNGQGIVTWYLSSVLTSVGITATWKKTLLNACIQLFNLLVAITGAVLVDFAGRRTLFLYATAGLFFSFIGLTTITAVYAQLHRNIGQAIIVFIFLVYAFQAIAYAPMITSYPSELWPQATRSKGLFTAMFFLNGATFFNIFVNPIALDAITWRYYCIYLGVQVVIFAVIYFTFPETKGYSLEEIALIFDKDEVTQAGLETDLPEKVTSRVSVKEISD